MWGSLGFTLNVGLVPSLGFQQEKEGREEAACLVTGTKRKERQNRQPDPHLVSSFFFCAHALS